MIKLKKKIIFFIVLLFIFYKNVYGETYYGEYREVIEIGDYKNDEIKIDSYKLYNTYNLEYIDMGYMLENYEYIKDGTDFKEELINVDINEYSDEYINNKINNNVTTYINILNKSTNSIKINELEIYADGYKRSFGYIGEKVDISALYDDDLNTYYEINANELFRINIYISYLIRDIKIIIHTKDENNYPLKLTLRNNDYDILLNNNNHNKHIITFNSELESYEYKAMKTLYRYFKEEKVKLNNYVKEGENILEEDYIIYNDFYVRDKLVLKDNLIINHSNMDVFDLIEYSTNNVKINCDINYKVNGTYKCEFIVSDIKVIKDITINIPSEKNNFTEEIKESNENLYNNENISNKINKVENVKDKDKNTYKKNRATIVIDNETEKEITKKISKEKETPKKTNSNIIDEKKSKVNVNKEKDKNLTNIVKIVIFINVILIEFILFIKKRKRNNVERV